MYSFQVPQSYQQAMQFDKENGNRKWYACAVLELAQVAEYDTFEDMGPDWIPPKPFQKISVHLVYAVKHDG